MIGLLNQSIKPLRAIVSNSDTCATRITTEEGIHRQFTQILFIKLQASFDEQVAKESKARKADMNQMKTWLDSLADQMAKEFENQRTEMDQLKTWLHEDRATFSEQIGQMKARCVKDEATIRSLEAEMKMIKQQLEPEEWQTMPSFFVILMGIIILTSMIMGVCGTFGLHAMNDTISEWIP